MHTLSGVAAPCARPGRAHPDREVERVQTLLLEVVAELLDPGFVRHRGWA
jgi:hypothetical protein